MSRLEQKLAILNPTLGANFEETKIIVSKLLQQYSKNFPTYTDHSIEHTQQVLNIAGEVLTNEEIDLLNDDEIYVLCMASILHDVGMCIPEEKIEEISNTEDLVAYRKSIPDYTTEKYIRDIHHVLSYRFINQEWKMLKIPSEKYAEAIGLVAQGHRKVDLNDFEVYDPQYFVKNGRDFVCLPFLSCVLRIADELDISNLRTPEILCKYYIPDNEISKKEWEKHKATIQVNFKAEVVIVEAKCTDHNMLAALEEQFEKIRQVINQCQKTIRSLHMVGNRGFGLNLSIIEPVYNYVDFDPKGIKYSFEVKNVINAFVGEDLYENSDAALREAIQNAVDACNYKKTIKKTDYDPEIVITVEDKLLSIEDNGQGMDEFIIENYFGKLASSFYQQEAVKSDFQAIGQFGIGVFSYFLISDYIDVETKRADKEGLKFRTDKDPNGYFHFFDNFKKEKEGTKLILHLKEDFQKEYSLEKIAKFIRDTFPFVNIPIFIMDGGEKVKIELDNMTLSFKDNVLPYVYYRSHKTADKFKILTVYLKNKRYEGILGLVLPKSFEDLDLKLRGIFDYNLFETKNQHTSDYSEIAISQKGVHINNYGARIRYVFGKFDLFEKLKVNLSRTSFINDREVFNILEELESQLLEKAFEEYYEQKGSKNKNHKKFTDWFIRNYWAAYEKYSKELKDSIMEHFCFEIIDKKKFEYLNLNEIPKRFEKFVIYTDAKEAEEFAELLNLPYVIVSVEFIWAYKSLFKKCIRFGEQIVNHEDKNFLLYDMNLYDEQKILGKILHDMDIYHDLIAMDSPFVGVNYWNNRVLDKEHEDYAVREGGRINLNHPLIKQLTKLVEDKKLNRTNKRLVQEVFQVISSYLYNYNKKDVKVQKVVDDVNSIIEKMLVEGTPNFKILSTKDFM